MITVDTRQFEKAVRFCVAAANKDSVTILNRQALVTVIGGKGVKGAIQRTPKAKKAAITGVNIKKVAASVVKKYRKRGVKIGGKALAKAIRNEYLRRIRSISYNAGPGWHKAAVALGGRGVKVQKGFEKSEARRGRGKKASPGSLLAKIVNTAPGIEKIGKEALQAALDDVARDMVEYGERKLQQSFNKVNRG